MNQHKKKSPSSNANHQVRIIGGDWKRTPITVISAAGLRPTPDRVRETVFNWIHHLIDGNWSRLTCLDLFAGSGALSFEAASRGAKEVLAVEAFTPAFQQLEQLKQKLKADQITLKRGDALVQAQNLIKQGERFDLIFLDPPFQQGFLEKILPLCVSLLQPGALVYVESGQALPLLDPDVVVPDWCAGWECLRSDKAGLVYFHLLQRNENSSRAA